MDRKELRFRILFEHYNRNHSDANYNLRAKIRTIDANDNEKRAAGIWLIEEGLVEGQVIVQVGIRFPSIGCINSKGVNFVESVMDDAFTEIRGKDEGFDSLSKIDKIKRFATECLGSHAAGPICQATYEAIVQYMSTISP